MPKHGVVIAGIETTVGIRASAAAPGCPAAAGSILVTLQLPQRHRLHHLGVDPQPVQVYGEIAQNAPSTWCVWEDSGRNPLHLCHSAA